MNRFIFLAVLILGCTLFAENSRWENAEKLLDSIIKNYQDAKGIKNPIILHKLKKDIQSLLDILNKEHFSGSASLKKSLLNIEEFLKTLSTARKVKAKLSNGNFPYSGWDTPDTYVAVYVADKEVLKTKVILDQSAPKWNENFEFFWGPGANIVIKVKDKDLQYDDILMHQTFSDFLCIYKLSETIKQDKKQINFSIDYPLPPIENKNLEECLEKIKALSPNIQSGNANFSITRFYVGKYPEDNPLLQQTKNIEIYVHWQVYDIGQGGNFCLQIQGKGPDKTIISPIETTLPLYPGKGSISHKFDILYPESGEYELSARMTFLNKEAIKKATFTVNAQENK